MADRWTETYTGAKINVLACDWTPSIVDIAHHASLICRFGGACAFHYSIAQHSVYAARLAPEEVALEALFHDCGEAMLGLDLMRPYKDEFPKLKHAEKMLEEYIALHFKLVYPWPPLVKEIDDSLLLHEARYLMPSAGVEYTVDSAAVEIVDLEIEEWTPRRAETEFLKTFYRLASKRFAVER